jgi:phosphoglycolate phosphatase-like HAD superfamily hydrolase
LYSSCPEDYIISIVQKILKLHNVDPVPSLEECRRSFTLPYMNFYKKYINDPDKEKLDRIYAESFKNAWPQPFPDAMPTLKFLEAQGIKMAVLSSHVQDYLELEIQRYFGGNCFVAVLGGVHDKEEVLGALLEENGFERSRTLYVADMVEDIVFGKKAGVLTAAVLTGYHFEDMLKAANPDFVLPDLSYLKQIISSQSAS